MKIPDDHFRRTIGEELAYVCDRLKADEIEILGKALRRGVLEIYKAVVLHDLATGAIDRKEAAGLLGSRVVDRVITGDFGPHRPGPRKIPRRRKK